MVATQLTLTADLDGRVSDVARDRTALQLKHAADRVVGAVLLVLLAPVLIGIALLVVLTSSGPATFRQRRVGHRGKTFTLWKFRSMYHGADADLAFIASLNEVDSVLFKIRSDPRVTPVGRFLRRFSLDELPQLWNVVRGEMSLIGPRPPLPSEVALYEERVHGRFQMRPGLTGLWQVSGRSDLSWDESVRLDLFYVHQWSPWLDLRILLRTFGAVLRSSGAY